MQRQRFHGYIEYYESRAQPETKAHCSPYCPQYVPPPQRRANLAAGAKQRTPLSPDIFLHVLSWALSY